MTKEHGWATIFLMTKMARTDTLKTWRRFGCCISQKTEDLDHSDAYSFDMVTNRGTDVRTQTYILPERDRSRAVKLEEQINGMLTGEDNIDVCTLLRILNRMMSEKTRSE